MKFDVLWVTAVFLLQLGSVELDIYPGWQASESLRWLRCIAVAVEMAVAQILKLHLTSWKVFFAVVSGTDGLLSSALLWMPPRCFTAMFLLTQSQHET